MTKRICWKKGMRLTDEILKSSDKCHLESLNQAFVLASNGRFGLLPSNREFEISLSVSKNIIDVEALNCLAITKSGNIIDINYDTSFTNNFDTRLTIPSNDEESYILCVETKDSWKETFNGYCEPEYKFSLIQENCMLSEEMFPVARIINEYGWRLDEINFIPPCLFISSHPEYKKHLTSFENILKVSNRQLLDSTNSDCKTAISIFWPIVEQLNIIIDKEVELMTPMMLLGNIQKFISGFLCACTLDEGLNLMEADTYRNFVDAQFNYKEVNSRIKEGLSLCNAICEKVGKFKDFTHVEEKIEAPTISNANLFKKCTNSKVRIPVENNTPGATIFYTIDGSEPTSSSNTGNTIVFASGFVGGRDKEEDDKYVVVKVKAVLNGISSITNTYKIRLQKDVKHWIEI